MSEITFLKGDATVPQTQGIKVIAHVCNDLGRWGKGFVLAISKRWNAPKEQYLQWHRNRSQNDFGLGSVQFVQAEKYIWVANMVGQRGIKTGSQGPPIRYEALRKCLETIAGKAQELRATVHMPRIGCGLAGGKWDRVEPIILETVCEAGIGVFVYDYEG